MTQEVIELLQKALALPERERAELAGTLIDSLDPVTDDDLEQAWQEEIARRIQALESGKVKAVSWGDVRKEAQAILNGKTAR